MQAVKIIPWARSESPTESAIRRLLDAENMTYYKWSNAPLDTYSAHLHPFDKVIYVVSGAITFGLPKEGRRIILNAGDRLDLPSGTLHDAVVSNLGVECLEAHL